MFHGLRIYNQSPLSQKIDATTMHALNSQLAELADNVSRPVEGHQADPLGTASISESLHVHRMPVWPMFQSKGQTNERDLLLANNHCDIYVYML